MRYSWSHAPDEGSSWRDWSWPERAQVLLVVAGIIALLLAAGMAGEIGGPA